VARPLKKLRTAVKELPDDAAPEELHRIRILAKRARYATEAAEPFAGKEAEALAEALAAVQDVLGAYQDAIVAEAWLRSAADGTDAAGSLAVGELIALQLTEAEGCRKRWPKAWKTAADEKLRKWL
jgi:CHAD domain-containing protein